MRDILDLHKRFTEYREKRSILYTEKQSPALTRFFPFDEIMIIGDWVYLVNNTSNEELELSLSNLIHFSLRV